MELPSLALAGLRVETMTISQSQGALIIIRIKTMMMLGLGKDTKDVRKKDRPKENP